MTILSQRVSNRDTIRSLLPLNMLGIRNECTSPAGQVNKTPTDVRRESYKNGSHSTKCKVPTSN